MANDVVGNGEGCKVLPWARLIQPLIPVEKNLRTIMTVIAHFGDGDWGNGRGNGRGDGDTDEYQGFKGRGAGQYGWRHGDGECRRS